MNVTSINIRVFACVVFVLSMLGCRSQNAIEIPQLAQEPTIDGELNEWKGQAWHDGVWDIDRVKESPWYHPKRNRLVRHADEDSNSLDLRAKYYLAWHGDWLYIGAEVEDNVNDVMDTLHEPKRWYYKDAISIFVEAPRDTFAEKFADGDHAFCFVIDERKPDYGAWWRHGSGEQSYIEEPIPVQARDYEVRLLQDGTGNANYVLEARVDLRKTLGAAFPTQEGGKKSRECSLMIVHCDPDGGEYGGHLLIYGKGDNDASWWPMRFVPAD